MVEKIDRDHAKLCSAVAELCRQTAGHERNHCNGKHTREYRKGNRNRRRGRPQVANRRQQALKAAPQVVAALATLIAAVEKPMAELAGAASNPLNIALDIQTAKDLKAVWPEVKAFLVTLGVKF
jgi:hypothetical protein